MKDASPTVASAEIGAVALFQDLPGADLEAIARRCRVRRFQAGEHILHFHDETSELFFVLEGQVRVLLYSPSGRDVSFRNIQPGQVFGELAAIDEGPRAASVVASSPTRLAVMYRHDLMALTHKHPSVAEALLRHLVGLIRRYSQRVYELSALRVEERIRIQILRLAWEAGDGGTSATLDPAPTLTELASLVSTTREAVSREIARLVREGYLKREGRTLTVCDLPALRSTVDEELA